MPFLSCASTVCADLYNPAQLLHWHVDKTRAEGKQRTNCDVSFRRGCLREIFEVRQLPAPAEIGLQRAVKPEIGKPHLPGIGPEPVVLVPRRRLRTDIEID